MPKSKSASIKSWWLNVKFRRMLKTDLHEIDTRMQKLSDKLALHNIKKETALADQCSAEIQKLQKCKEGLFLVIAMS